jgi:hypothetical protein
MMLPGRKLDARHLGHLRPKSVARVANTWPALQRPVHWGQVDVKPRVRLSK